MSRRDRQSVARPARGADAPNLLDMVPVREAEWELDADGRVTLIPGRPPVRGPRSFVRWLSSVTGPARVRLDDVGSCAWRHLDGETDVRTLCGVLRDEFGERVEPVPERLGQLIRILRRERLVSYRTPKTVDPGA